MQIHAAGASVEIFDPKAMENAKLRFPTLAFAQSIDECLAQADIVLHLTEWQVFREINPTVAATLVNNPIIIDGRNALDRELWQMAGWKVRALGRAS